MTEKATLLEDIEDFLERNPAISPSRLGREALNDWSFVRDLRGENPSLKEARKVWPDTEKKVRNWMENFERG